MKKIISLLIISSFLFIGIVNAESAICESKWGMATLKGLKSVVEDYAGGTCEIMQLPTSDYRFKDNVVCFCHRWDEWKNMQMVNSYYNQLLTVEGLRCEDITYLGHAGKLCSGTICGSHTCLSVREDEKNLFQEDKLHMCTINRDTCTGTDENKWDNIPISVRINVWLKAIWIFFTS